MTRIKVFKTRKGISIFFIIFGAVFTILGILLIIKTLIHGFNTKFPSGDWNSVIYSVQGVFFIIIGSTKSYK